MALSIRDRRVQISIAVAIFVVILVVGISVTVLGGKNRDEPAGNLTTTVSPVTTVPAQMAKIDVEFKKAKITEALPPGTTTGIRETEVTSTLQATIGTEASTTANTVADQTEAAATVPPAVPA